MFLGRVPLADYGTPACKEIADPIIDVITPDTNTVLMGNHGTVSFAKDLEWAYYKLENVDAYANICLLSMGLGGPSTLQDKDMSALLDIKKRFKISAKGKVMMAQAGKRHGMIKRTNSQIRKLRGTTTMSKQDSKIVKSYMPYSLRG